jgi:uncharacterized protein
MLVIGGLQHLANARREMTAKIEDLAARRAREAARRSESERLARLAGPSKSAAPSSKLCPICGRPRQDEHRPFCSRRCAEIDLGRWLKEGYRVPGGDTVEGSEDETEN